MSPDGSIVDKNVNAAEFADRSVDDLPAMIGILDVTPNQHDLATGLFHPAGRILASSSSSI